VPTAFVLPSGARCAPIVGEVSSSQNWTMPARSRHILDEDVSFGGMFMLGISRLAASATFGGVLVLLAALAAPSSARADVTEVFNLFGEFDNGSTLSGTVTIDVTNGSATAIDAAADSFTFNTITNQGPQFTEYVVRAGSAGSAAQLYLAFGVGSLLGYGGSSLSSDTQIDGAVFLKGGGANPNESSPVPEPSTWALMIVGFAGVGFLAIRRAGTATAATTA
jgi:hypothetical protein